MKTQILKITSLLTLVLFTAIGYAQNHTPQAGKQSVEQLKNSPAGGHVVAVINGINGLEAVNETFIKKHFSPASIKRNGIEKLVNILSKEIPQHDGKLTLFVADRPSTFEYNLMVKGSIMNEWIEISFKLENDSPYRIEGFGIEAGENVLPPLGNPSAMKLD